MIKVTLNDRKPLQGYFIYKDNDTAYDPVLCTLAILHNPIVNDLTCF